MEEIFNNVFIDGDKLYTKNLISGEKVYGEKLIDYKGKELREWNPRRSKLAAAIMKGYRELPFKKDSKILYLGASTGTTVSHVSDIVEIGKIFSVEISERSMRQFLKLSEMRENVYPILGDASRPNLYSGLLEQVDFIYQDVAQKHQQEILVKNSVYLKKRGIVFYCVKARSIDSIRAPEEIFKEEIKNLEKYFNVIKTIDLSPYEKDHIMIIASLR
ncbi:MAG: Fibrillarin-like rRNA/tRNA 2'-O-methyltransferase [Candidatus Methanofastidiosum methylothiophilum]|uniref:Fibrillarin-like rRNA/tRNA 2'-O-methyltransferase n=1 Tax=Candidatus Methanofastidiosum methylothiophilum TaxID=1705564 RepID=A0A150J6S5_9EURY|nr:MAG: Fibrillarin-like rRNA/tRNA 2'-O-methyltransferase [Candidatus Methanofastidiosum methylthiophilus]NMC76978.1 fibrillarin-like rRNA/tRNA 2'-O-methyltransferase [Candidatus Methanofastidiosa archaeon]